MSKYFYLVETRKNGSLRLSTGSGIGIWRRRVRCVRKSDADRRQLECEKAGRKAVVIAFANTPEALTYCNTYNKEAGFSAGGEFNYSK